MKNGMKIEGFTAGPLQANTYVVVNGDRAFVIDPGIGSADHVREIVSREGVTCLLYTSPSPRDS